MKRSLLYIFLLFPLFLSAQNIEMLYQNEDYKPNGRAEELQFIDANMDVSSDSIIATYKLKIDKQGKNNLSKVFYQFYEMGLDDGGNTFTIESVETTDTGYVVTVSLYNLNDEKKEENFSFYEPNIVVVFGHLDTKKINKPKGFKVNGEKVEIMPYTYLKYQNEIGEKTKISVGGAFGASTTVKGEEYKLIRCFSLGGGMVMPMVPMGGGMGISFNTGNIIPVEPCFGLFLMTVLDNKE